MKSYAIALFLFLISLVSYSQSVVSPLDIPLYLSGNFGELRSNHFHSGIDFKTQGVIGKAVKAVKDGYVSRISISPYGYGRALYIDHPDGTTSVYGHLDHFADKIEQAVLDSQYQKESFAVNLHFSPEQFPLNQAEVFAYSGNTGGSGGPHIHFEFRDTETERPFDPLPYFKDKIKDNRPPEIRGLMAYPIEGVINGSTNKQEVILTQDKLGIVGKLSAWGVIGFGIKAYDRMTDTSNIYGVNEIILRVDGEEVYHSVMDRFSFDDTRYLNSYIDWKEWIENKSFFMKSFVEPGNYLGVNHSLEDGLIYIEEERVYLIEYELSDVYGNKNTLRFEVTGKGSEIPEPQSAELYFPFNDNNEYEGKGIELSIPIKNLYTNTFLDVDTISGYTPYAPLYQIGDRIPLHSYCPLVLDVVNDTYPDPSKYGVVYVYNNRKNWLGGEYQNGKIHAKVRELGNFAIMIDHTPPVITPVNPTKWTTNKKISFKITDDLSGIASYKGTLDDEFVLFEYDAKNNSLFCTFDSKRMKKGPQKLDLEVSDSAGNISHYSKAIVF